MKFDEVIMKCVFVRYFKDDLVSDEEIRVFIEVVIRVFMVSGFENWFFVVFKSEEVWKEIYDFIGEGMVEYYCVVNLLEEKIKKFMKRIYEEGMYWVLVYIVVFIDRRVCFFKGWEFDEVEFIWSVESVVMVI